MPLKKRTDKSRRKLDSQHIDQLLNGWPMIAGSGFSEGIGGGGCNGWADDDWQAFRDAAAEGWNEHGAEILRWWRGETEAFTAMFRDDPRTSGAQMWALETFGEPPCP